MHTCFGRYTVNDVKRVVVVERADTAYAYCSRTRRRTVCRNVHTRNTSLQSLHRVVFVLFGNLVNAHYRDSTCQVGFALCGVACHYHLVEVVDLLLQRYAHVCTGFSFYCFISYIRYDKRCTIVYLKVKMAVNVGHCSRFRSFLNDGSTNNAFSCRIKHHSLHVNLLCIGHYSYKTK